MNLQAMENEKTIESLATKGNCQTMEPKSPQSAMSAMQETYLSKPHGAYRHGDLRNALIKAATDLTVQRADADFTLREIAEITGVRHAAVYRHFASKEALVTEIAAQSAQNLIGALEAALDSAKTDPLGLIPALCKAFLAFTKTRPGEYRAMTNALQTDTQQTALIAIIEKTVTRAQKAKACRADISAPQIACLLWAQMQGLSMLEHYNVSCALNADEALSAISQLFSPKEKEF